MKYIKPISLTIFAVAVLALGALFVQAQSGGSWSEPACGPTGCNKEAPINVSSSAQGKNSTPPSGSMLDIGGVLSANNLSTWGNANIGGSLTGGTASNFVINAQNSSADMNLNWSSGRNLYIGRGSGSSDWLAAFSGNGDITFKGNGVWAPAFFYSSDRNLKNNITALDSKDSLSKVLNLQATSFSWKESGRSDIGLIAQDVEKIYPELVHTDKTTGLKSVEYANLVAPLIEAVKAQQKEIDALKAEVEALKQK